MPSRIESSNKKVEPEDALSSMAAAVVAAPVMSQTSQAQMVYEPLTENNKENQADTQAKLMRIHKIKTVFASIIQVAVCRTLKIGKHMMMKIRTLIMW